ncbi:MAG TPA: ABC transporter permease subunit [Ruminiclostridium sp.]
MNHYVISPRKRFKDIMRRYWVLYALVFPCIVFLIVFRYIPLILQVILAFKDYKLAEGIWGSRWVGFDNFVQILTAPEISQVVYNTFYLSLLRLITGFLPPIILAILLFDLLGHRLKRICQTIIYIPHFFSWTVVYAVTYAFFSNGGLVNSLLSKLGLSGRNYLVEENWFLPLLLGSAIWKEIGWNTIIYLAALTSINTELYEVAKIDGAGPLKRIQYVTLPGIRNVVIFLLVLSLGNILRGAGMEQILLFYSPPVFAISDVIDTWVYRMGLSNLEYSLGCAVSFFQSAFGLVTILICNKLSVKYTKVGLW